MKKNKEYMAKLRAMTEADLEKELASLSTQIFHLRTLIVSGQQIKTHFFRDHKKRIAKIQTVLNEKKAK